MVACDLSHWARIDPQQACPLWTIEREHGWLLPDPGDLRGYRTRGVDSTHRRNRAAGCLIGHRGPEPLDVDVSQGQNLVCPPEAFLSLPTPI